MYTAIFFHAVNYCELRIKSFTSRVKRVFGYAESKTIRSTEMFPTMNWEERQISHPDILEYTTKPVPDSEATCIRVLPSLVLASGSALTLSTSRSTICVWPLSAAICRAVLWCCNKLNNHGVWNHNNILYFISLPCYYHPAFFTNILTNIEDSVTYTIENDSQIP